MSIVTCSCKFRGKDTELSEGKCPRCGTSIGQETTRKTTRRKKADASK